MSEQSPIERQQQKQQSRTCDTCGEEAESLISFSTTEQYVCSIECAPLGPSRGRDR